jgi:hypothetical protein
MHGFPDNLHISLRDFAVAWSWRGELVRKSAAFLSRRIRAFGLSIRVITNSYSREFRLRLRSGARLLANELLGRAVQIARRIAGGVHGTSRRPTTTQAFWQFMTCVSQATKHAVDVCDDIKGVGVNGTGWTSPGG